MGKCGHAFHMVRVYASTVRRFGPIAILPRNVLLARLLPSPLSKLTLRRTL